MTKEELKKMIEVADYINELTHEACKTAEGKGKLNSFTSLLSLISVDTLNKSKYSLKAKI